MSTHVAHSLPERAEHPAAGEVIPSHYRWCFGCGADHETGLHLKVLAGEGLTVTGTFVVTDHHQGAPGLAHGGLLTTAMDEVLGSLNWLLAAPAVTGRLSCEFRRPVPVGSTLFITAEVTGQKGRRVFGSAVARLDSPTGQVAVSAESVFVQVPIDHFLTNGAQEQVKQALQDRASGGPSWRPGSSVEINP